ncbi:uncharacterized protein K452DRAFT_328891 [Aplosporella prunicola CBS 121167]|uniref:Tyrosine specific protein phosphatases domain-containing protein n=1 Tax=Aplosporella prunicola CBS 121167 TaxID=1176127 RepID=A0A6A6B4N4_9PEZI|nr:uncharacterized protein K452DRAFT_328891 [Aplosporella prunicola CBS 121167]KAF2138363.1 hypothetical protein K452DRAFT_328891 [Aplosporella prunicola CBS 121167]
MIEPQLIFSSAPFNATLIQSLGAESRLRSFVAKALSLIGVDIAGPLTTADMVKLALVCGLVPGLWLHRQRMQSPEAEKPGNDSTADVSDTIGEDAVATDPGLLKKHSVYRSYAVPQTGFTYPSIRTFHRPHPQGEKLPSKPTPLPLLVFVHGLGGSAAQFQSLLTSFVNLAPCLAIDLPGCGLSKFAPKAWEAYETSALVHLLATVIEEHRDKDVGQGVIFIGHSMGCSLSALLASKTSPYSYLLSEHVLGLIAVCPKAEPASKEQAAKFRKLLTIPGPIFDLWRTWDRRGGTKSASVQRFVGPEAEEETKRLQVRFNQQSRTPTWRRMAKGMLGGNGLPGRNVWAGLDLPVFLVAGEADPVTPADEVRKITTFLGKEIRLNGSENPEPIPDSAAPVNLGGAAGSPQTYRTGSVTLLDNVDTASLSMLDGSSSSEEESPVDVLPKRRCLKTVILPSPASHALLYAPSTARTLSGLIQSFLAERIDKRLSLGWQLQYLTTEGKWDVKNLVKWQAVQPVSEPIAGTFRAMKTLREVDDKHRPAVFVQDWSGKIRAVVDISHESPVYDPNGLERGGIQYHKFPTVSKLPPTVDEVKQFITMIDRLREEPDESEEYGGKRPLIGVHCHYGFNRTGFFIVSYLVERLGWGLQAAINEFAQKRPPGIRHEHFIDTLFVRYHVGLQRAPTL